MATILLLHGPNLNLLGKREPHLYGSDTLADVERLCREAAAPHDVASKQTNYEGAMLDWIHAAREDGTAGIVINAGAWTHTSIALLDALNAYEGPVMEVHVTQVHRREPFRHHSYVSLRADGVIAGFGVEGYAAAVRRVAGLIG